MAFKRLAHPLYGAMFNLLYWQGITDALGGSREHFLAVINSEKREHMTNEKSDKDIAELSSR
jgi:hypothetical protein